LNLATAVSKENRAKVHLSAVCQKRLPVAMQYRWSILLPRQLLPDWERMERDLGRLCVL